MNGEVRRLEASESRAAEQTATGAAETDVAAAARTWQRDPRSQKTWLQASHRADPIHREVPADTPDSRTGLGLLGWSFWGCCSLAGASGPEVWHAQDFRQDR
ncbi:unnamed protein product [Polarella glacialis]|uniref:Uncharacterized protein n=1 Tax=Polarella glacialis TaxID=89957 RepID=A0A813GDK2_POLGL|nr:unnamed protein product [Polarella glacialis]